MKPKKFMVKFLIIDNDPVGDSRDGKAIWEILTREFGYDSYDLIDISIEELSEEKGA